MLSIGQVKVPSSLVLAPMAGISDLPYRLINREFGCGLAFTEMISAKSLVYKNARTLKMLSAHAADRPLGVQIFGSDPEIIKRALDTLSGHDFDIIDFNAACPVKKVVSAGEGASLLKDPVKLQKILKVLAENSRAAVTVKIRSGWDETSVNAVDIARRAQDAGIQGVFIHGRTKVQGYRGTVDYRVIRDIKRHLAVPVIGSGDALNPLLIKKMFAETGCDGVAVARGALGNPWIFRDTEEYLKSGTPACRPHVHEIARIMKKHLALIIRFHGESSGIKLFRKFFVWYTRGIPVKHLKVMAFSANTVDDMLRLAKEMEADRSATVSADGECAYPVSQ